jgi:hypothetical protein
LALFATLGVAVLPNGQLPKIAGPCGRALCNCAPVVEPFTAVPNGSCHACRAPRVLTLGGPLISGADAAGSAFQIMIDGAIGAPVTQAFLESVDDSQEAIRHRTFAVKHYSFDVPTPPPRA